MWKFPRFKGSTGMSWDAFFCTLRLRLNALATRSRTNSASIATDLPR